MPWIVSWRKSLLSMGNVLVKGTGAEKSWIKKQVIRAVVQFQEGLKKSLQVE